MEKRRQEVLEKRRQAAAEQKKKEQEDKRKFMAYEQRKQALKEQAAKEAHEQKLKAQAAAAATQEKLAKTKAAVESSISPSRTTSPPKPQTPPLPTSAPKPTSASKWSASSSASLEGSHDSGNSNQPSVATPLSATNLNVPNLPSRPPSRSTSPAPPAVGIRGTQVSNGQMRKGPPLPNPNLSQASTSTPKTQPSGADLKYRNMVSQGPKQSPPTKQTPAETLSPTKQWTEEEILSYTSNVKRQILLQWGLVPPNYQVLKPIDQLLATIQSVYPPAFQVAPHKYFEGWKSLNIQDLQGPSADSDSLLLLTALDSDKLKKAVRKLRFFLHPDKLPKDLDPIQEFVCKLLWDVTNDAYEDYKKQTQET